MTIRPNGFFLLHGRTETLDSPFGLTGRRKKQETRNKKQETRTTHHNHIINHHELYILWFQFNSDSFIRSLWIVNWELWILYNIESMSLFTPVSGLAGGSLIGKVIVVRFNTTYRMMDYWLIHLQFHRHSRSPVSIRNSARCSSRTMW